jgi:hypothetical protein
VYTFIHNSIFFSFTIRLFIEGSLEILVSSFLNISYPITETYGEWLSLVFSYFFATLQGIIAVVIAFYFSRKFGKLGITPLKEKWIAVTEEINIDRYSSSFYFPLFITRRAIFVITATYLDGHDLL